MGLPVLPDAVLRKLEERKAFPKRVEVAVEQHFEQVTAALVLQAEPLPPNNSDTHCTKAGLRTRISGRSS